MAQTRKFEIIRRDSDRVVSAKLISKEELKIGREAVDNDLNLNHSAVSDVHAVIREVNGRPWILDFWDENATFLNGRNITRAPLRDGDEIQIGPFSLQVQVKQDLISITVQRELKPVVRPITEGLRAECDEIEKAELNALDMIFQDRKREASKVAISTPLYPVGIYSKGKARFNWTSTRDLKPPIRREAWQVWVGLGVALASICALFFYGDFYSPGPLASAHSSPPAQSRGIALSTVSSCSDCHHLLGNKERDCTDCHNVQPGYGGAVRGFDPKISDAHQEANIGCVGCHIEHGGADFKIKDVNNRSCMYCHNESYVFRGKVVGAPHKGSAVKSNPDSAEQAGVGYIRDDNDLLTWKHKTGQDAVTQFHVEHPYAQQECTYCHKGVRGEAQWQQSPRGACQACHAVSFDPKGFEAIGPNCATCHTQHGKHKDLKPQIARVSEGDLKRLLDQVRKDGLYSFADTTEPFTPVVTGGAGERRQGAFNWKDWVFSSGLGFAPLQVWTTASLGIFAFGGTLLLGVGNIRRRKFLREESARRRNSSDVQGEQETEAAGYPKRPPPAYTFPIIYSDRCIGCHRCIEACPHDVLAMSNMNIAMLIAPLQCMDDTRCQTACPTQACVVASTEKIIPEDAKPDRDQETYMANMDRPGLYVIGDAAKIPLLKHAIVEGACVIDRIENALNNEGENTSAQHEVAIIGAGPAGLSAALRAAERKLTYVLIERDKVLATIEGYPTGKNVNLKTEGDEPKGLLPLPPAQERRREEILEFWKGLIEKNQIKINQGENCVNIEPGDEIFTVTTSKNDGCETVTYTARKVVLAIGSCGLPSLKTKGADLTTPIERPATTCHNCNAPREPRQEVCSSCNEKIDESRMEIHPDARVKYKLDNARFYDGKHCVVVGGGNSAVEAAVQLTGFEPGVPEPTFTRNDHVTLLVRTYFTEDLKLVNKMKLYDCSDAGRIKIRFGTEIKEIRDGEVILMNKKKEEAGRIPNDYIFCCIGTRWPQDFLEKVGIRILNKKQAGN